MQKERRKLFDWRLIRIPRAWVRFLLVLFIVVSLLSGLVIAVKLKADEVPFLARVGGILGIYHSALEVSDDSQGSVIESRSAKLIFVKGNVTVKSKQELRFRRAKRGRILHEGDSIRTYSGGYAEVTFDDGNRLMIKPDSYVVIRAMKQNRFTKIKKSSINLQQSDVEATIRRPKVAGSEFVIVTPTAHATISEAKVAIRVTKEKESRMKVFKGTVALQVGTDKVEITENQSVTISHDSRVEEIKDLPPPPVLDHPENLAEFFFKSLNGMKTVLKWRPVPKNVKYRLQVALDPFFTDFVIVRTGLSEPGVVIQGLKSGIYYWRVNTITSEGREGDFSDYRVFKVTIDKTPPFIRLDDIILLKVAGTLKAQVSGETEAKALVTINGTGVHPDKMGRFKYMLSGIQPDAVVRIVAEDSVGNRKVLKKRIEVR
ncbi:MAG: hypothetical protein GXP58_01265 [Deltaproteobacteria bacterium]|nr:hypothetical protein [Deltaproteobacteria bacterium]